MNFLSKKILTVALGIFVAVLGLTLLSVNSPKVNAACSSCNITPTPTVTICHGNNDVNNPYVRQSPNIQNNGTLDGGHLNDIGPIATSLSVAQSLKTSKTQWGDIIPAYTSGNFIFAGLNWTTIGQAMFHNNCGYVTPVCTDPHATNYVANPTTAQYSDNTTCTYTPAGTCPTACGHQASTVPDGKGGTISCNATLACIKECTDETALNFYDDEIDPKTQVVDNSVCLYTLAGTCPTACGQAATQVPNGHGGFTQCSATPACVVLTHNTCNPDLHTCIQVAGPGQSSCLTNNDCQPHHFACVNNACAVVNTAGTDSCKKDTDCAPTPTVTPTPTQTPSNPGGPGDGRSDGKSDGGSSCPSCTQAPHTQVLGASTGPEQAVLGASTMAGTGTFENTLMEIMVIAGTIVLGTGLKSYAKEKKN